MTRIEKFSSTLLNAIQKTYDAVGESLDQHPTLYKVVLVAAHFFRAAAMFSFMMWMPTPLPVTIGIMVAGSLLYRAAVERFCCFRFTLPSLTGAGAAWLTQLAHMSIASKAALTALGMALHALTFLPLLGYAIGVIYLAHRDVENRREQLKLKEPSAVLTQVKVSENNAPDCCHC